MSPPLRPPAAPPLSTIERINARYTRGPDAPWSADGAAPPVGLLIHCFDFWGREESAHPWMPNLQGRDNQGNVNDDSANQLLLSSSFIWAARCVDQRGQMGGMGGWAGSFLYGHGCQDGGVILRPGNATRIVCGLSHDAGGYCHDYCPPSAEHDATCDEGAWHPEDAPAYLHRQSSYLTWYNEFLVDGRHWARHMPLAVEAFIAGTAADGKAEAVQRFHRDFLATYRLSPAEVPLVAATCECGGSWPYVEASSVPYDPCRIPRWHGGT